MNSFLEALAVHSNAGKAVGAAEYERAVAMARLTEANAQGIAERAESAATALTLKNAAVREAEMAYLAARDRLDAAWNARGEQ